MAYDSLPVSEKRPSTQASNLTTIKKAEKSESMLVINVPRVAHLQISGWGLLAIVLFLLAFYGSHHAVNCYSQHGKPTMSAPFRHHTAPGVSHAPLVRPAMAMAAPWPGQSWLPPTGLDVISTTERQLVPFEAHIMSKCPDAKVCLRQLVLPAMQRVFSKVNFTLSYIGTPTENDGVECMHGAPECMGNILELCAAHIYPDPKIYLGFVMCLTRDYEEIPQKSLVADCALEHGIDFGKLNECASSDDGLGMGMLRDSVLRSSDAGITTSCTVRVNEEIYCIRDGGEWKDCKSGAGVNDIVIAIEKLYSSS